MNHVSHASAKPSHYTNEAEHYDAFNEKNSKIINSTIENILKKHNVKTVLDLTCGTGSQVFWLTKRGYRVVGSDINASMLNIATRKVEQNKLDVKLIKGDMRTLRVGQFDAVITIFNAIGHLTKCDFEHVMQNVRANLKEGGLYLFDINNLSYLQQNNNITNLTIDWQKSVGDTITRYVQYSTIDKGGILASYTTHITQEGSNKPKISKGIQTLQVYNAEQLRKMLESNEFMVLTQCGIDESNFTESETDCILTVAQKR